MTDITNNERMGHAHLTNNERLVLRAIRHNFFADGMEPIEAQIWSDCINDSEHPSGIEGKSLSGVVGSLVTKGLIWSDGECVGLTKTGAAAARQSDDGN